MRKIGRFRFEAGVRGCAIIALGTSNLVRQRLGGFWKLGRMKRTFVQLGFVN